VRLLINSSSGRKLAEFQANGTIEQVKHEFSKVQPKYYPDRQKLCLNKDSPGLADQKSLDELGLKDGDSLVFKDLGPQLGWTTVFLVEYSGPLFIYMFFYLRNVMDGQSMSDIQLMAFVTWSFHYAKRVFETIFVHRFSHGTMPLSNLFKNCSYYWGFAALVAYFLNIPGSHPDSPHQTLVYAGFASFLLFELCNGITHLQLRNLRPAGSKARNIPRGFAFNLVSCPNYTFEILAWMSFSFFTWSLPALAFTVVGAVQMWFWAVKKHKIYRKEFANYPKGRKVLIPFVL